MCKVFPSSLGPTAMRWFNWLEARSIRSYKELTRAWLDLLRAIVFLNPWITCFLWPWERESPWRHIQIDIGSSLTIANIIGLIHLFKKEKEKEKDHHPQNRLWYIYSVLLLFLQSFLCWPVVPKIFFNRMKYISHKKKNYVYIVLTM